MRRLLLAAALVLAPVGARASYSKGDAGTSSGQFLKLGADARSAGIGNAVRASAEDANAVYWNPAGLASLKVRHATLSHGAYYQSVFYDFIAYGQPVKSVLGRSERERELRTNQLGAFAVGLLYLNAGKLSEVDNTGTVTGTTFTPQDFAFMAGWGSSLTRSLDLGASFKYISSRIRGSASTGAVDLGARMKLHVFDLPYAAAFTVQNIGGRLKFVDQADPLPLAVSIGQSLRLAKRWMVNLDLVAPKDNGLYPAFGTEFRLPLEANVFGALLLGYDGRTSAADLSGLTGLTFGGGIGVSRFAFDYAWAPYGLLGDAHRLSLSYRF